jgi:hypothetical protein
MPRRSTGVYPSNWDEIATAVKEAAGWRCVRCQHPHAPGVGRCLTVHHLDMNPANNRWFNTVALCQRCHLTIQGKVKMAQAYLYEHSEWFKPYVAGFYAFTVLGRDLTREEVDACTDYLLSAGQPWLVSA